MSPNKITLDGLEQFSKRTAGVILLIYALGFLVTSLYYSQLGITHFDLWRPRIVGAGLLLVGLQISAYAIGRGAFALPIDSRDHRGVNRLLSTVLSLSQLALECELFSMVVWQMTDYSQTSLARTADIGVIQAALVLVGYLAWRIAVVPSTFVRVLVGTCGAVTIGLLCGALLISGVGRGVLGLAGWLAALSVVGIGVGYIDLSPTMNMTSLALQVLFYLSIFTHYIYPHFRPEWGGGAPTLVTITFNRDAGYLAGRVTPAMLLDESDEGFYLVDRNVGHTYFVPRASISLIDYEGRGR